jgi:hypothetical protein
MPIPVSSLHYRSYPVKLHPFNRAELVEEGGGVEPLPARIRWFSRPVANRLAAPSVVPPPGVEPGMPFGHGVTARFPPQGIVGMSVLGVESNHLPTQTTPVAKTKRSRTGTRTPMSWLTASHVAGLHHPGMEPRLGVEPRTSSLPRRRTTTVLSRLELGEEESNPRRRDSKSRLDAINHLQSATGVGIEPTSPRFRV